MGRGIEHIFSFLLIILLLHPASGIAPPRLIKAGSAGPAIPVAEEPPWTNWMIEAVVRVLKVEGDYLWIGTSGGLLRYHKKEETYTLYTTKDGLLSSIILSIAIDKRGTKWFGTYGGGLSKFDGRNWTTYTPYGAGRTSSYQAGWAQYTPEKGLGDLWVYGIAFDRKERMWVATWSGASLFEGESFTTYTTTDGIVDKWVYTLLIDGDGVLWFGTEGGVTSFDGQTFRSWTHEDGLGKAIRSGQEKEEDPREEPYIPGAPHHLQPKKQVTQYNPNYVVSSAIDQRGVKWFGTWGGGLSRFDGKRWKTYTSEDGLAGDVVHALAVDPQGILWIGTNGGVSRFDGTSFKNFTVRDGLFGGTIYSIAIDPDGSKWFGSFGGLSRYRGD